MRNSLPYFCPFCSCRLPRSASKCFFCERPLPAYKRSSRSRLPRNRTTPKVTKPIDSLRVHIPAGDFAPLKDIARKSTTGRAVSRLLARKIDAAIVCSENLTPPSIVRMGSEVLVHNRRDDGAEEKIRGVLVYPEEHYHHLPSILVSSPLGAAILGLKLGDSAPYTTGEGSDSVATVERVMPFNPRHDSVGVIEYQIRQAFDDKGAAGATANATSGYADDHLKVDHFECIKPEPERANDVDGSWEPPPAA